jgi:hypothetical protein
MQLKLVLLLIVIVATGVQAQEARTRENSDDQPQSVSNDDRGRAFIIASETQSLPAPASHGRIITEPQQNSIFLGMGWAAPSLRASETELASLLANIRDQSQLTTLDQYGMKNFFAATTSQEKVDVATDRAISDLEIQSILEGMLKSGALQRPNASTVYVVYLDPGMHSTLGTMIAGKHYVAYHSVFNAAGLKINYAVVPFASNQKAAYQIALRAFLAAALNPNGTGS